ncbi:unnamed protein product [Larinioides sclopetarius]|uniref:TBC1 domain family member 7 n=1 Tax=Larinioides sclopetarius TaxID=280406 RepID=A0AAV2B7F3_9ARAC
MGDKNRNFRSSYYDKVGFRGVEEKKSLEILINEKPMDKEKLSKFCLRFTLPAIYREYVWKVLLGVLPVNVERHNSILNQRSEYYKDLEHSLEIMRKITKETPKAIIHTLMFLLTEEVLDFETQRQLEAPEVQNIIALANFFLDVCSTEIAFWMLRNFILYQQKFSVLPKFLVENLESILRQEDDALYEHLKKIRTFEVLPLDMWFGRYFAGVIHESSLARIFDKVMGGSCKILPYVAASLLIVRRHLLLPLVDSAKIVDILKQNPEDISDMVVNKALDLYS